MIVVSSKESKQSLCLLSDREMQPSPRFPSNSGGQNDYDTSKRDQSVSIDGTQINDSKQFFYTDVGGYIPAAGLGLANKHFQQQQQAQMASHSSSHSGGFRGGVISHHQSQRSNNSSNGRHNVLVAQRRRTQTRTSILSLVLTHTPRLHMPKNIEEEQDGDGSEDIDDLSEDEANLESRGQAMKTQNTKLEELHNKRKLSKLLRSSSARHKINNPQLLSIEEEKDHDLELNQMEDVLIDDSEDKILALDQPGRISLLHEIQYKPYKSKSEVKQVKRKKGKKRMTPKSNISQELNEKLCLLNDDWQARNE